MIEAAMIWNEPNNKSHWDPEIDPDWTSRFAAMAIAAADAIAAVDPHLPTVLGGMSPIDPHFIRLTRRRTACSTTVDAVAVHGFPLDWNLWKIDEWPAKIDEIKAVTSLPVWVSEVGVSTFGADEVQVFGFDRTAELLVGNDVPRIHWYSLYDLPREWGGDNPPQGGRGVVVLPAFRDGPAAAGTGRRNPRRSALPGIRRRWASASGSITHDHRLDDAVAWLKRLGVTYLRTGLSWADSFRPDALGWFDRQMEALADFDVTVTFCFTPEHRGLAPHHSSAPIDPAEFADFCASMIERYPRRAPAAPLTRGAAAAPVGLIGSPALGRQRRRCRARFQAQTRAEAILGARAGVAERVGMRIVRRPQQRRRPDAPARQDGERHRREAGPARAAPPAMERNGARTARASSASPSGAASRFAVSPQSRPRSSRA